MVNTKFAKTRVVLLGLIIILPLLIGLFQPMDADDYAYRERVSSQGLTGFFNDFYNNTGGRILNIFAMYANSLSHSSFLTMGILNGLILVLSIYILGSFVAGHRLRLGELQDSLVFVVLFYLVWFGLPNLGSAVFWHSGSASYLLPTFFEILFFALFFSQRDNTRPQTAGSWFWDIVKAIAVFGIGAVAASAAEQVVVSGFFGIGFAVFWLAKTGGFRWRLHLPAIIGFLLGTIVLLAAPGNYVRFGHVSEHTGLVATLANAIAHFGLYFGNYLYGTFAGFVLLLFYWRDKSALFSKKLDFLQFKGWFLAIAAFSSMFIFAVVWAVSPRTFMYFVAFFAAAFTAVLLFLERRRIADGRGTSPNKLVAVFGVLSVLLIVSMANGLYSNIVLASELSERQSFVQSEIAKGNKLITITGPDIIDPRISYYTSVGPRVINEKSETIINLVEPGHKNFPEVFRMVKQNLGNYLSGK